MAMIISTAARAPERLSGGRGNDHIDGSGSSDYDWVSYDYADRGVIVDLSIGTAYVANNDQDTLLNIENVIGSAFNDDIVGTDGVDTIIGGAGFDDLAGRAATMCSSRPAMAARTISTAARAST
ncbi:MAG: hypothetical protein R3D33_16550 [Hyphomicrobiaceae bacterium]